nr:MAG TPA: hypothetical protein [Caudoviricetes sp.]
MNKTVGDIQLRYNRLRLCRTWLFLFSQLLPNLPQKFSQLIS